MFGSSEIEMQGVQYLRGVAELILEKFCNYTCHGVRTPKESFFSKIRNFWAWADKLGSNFMGHLGYFWPNY
jgi:hypothetical protein